MAKTTDRAEHNQPGTLREQLLRVGLYLQDEHRHPDKVYAWRRAGQQAANRLTPPEDEGDGEDYRP